MALTDENDETSLSRAAALYRSGNPAEAEALCRQLLDTCLDKAGALHLLGLIRLAASDYAGARDFLAGAVQAAPDDAFCHYNLGEACRCLGSLPDAVESYEKAIELRPGFVEARNNLAIVLTELGLTTAAVRCYEHALAIAPDSARTLLNLGVLLAETGRVPEAIERLTRSIALDPSNMAAYQELARAFPDEDRPDGKSKRFAETLGNRPDRASILSNLSEALQGMCRPEEALAAYDQAVFIDPQDGRAYHDRGMLLARLGRTDAAHASLREAVGLEPHRVEWRNDLGRFCYEQGLIAEAKALFQAVIDEDDGFAMGHAHLGAILAEEGLTESAADHFRKADALEPHAGVKVILATLAPVIPGSVEKIEETRRAMERNIDDLLRSGLTVPDPVRHIGRANFYVPYQGLEDRRIQTRLGELYESVCPTLDYMAPHCRGPRELPEGRRMRIGFISRHLKNHTVGNYMKGIVAHLDKDRFEKSLFLLPGPKDETTRFFEEHADAVFMMPEDLDPARRVIASAKLDILFYPDIGMEPFTYFLAFSRLAPVQCAFYGHPVTTGIRTIDYFISHQDCEVAEGDDHYSEKLVRLSEGVTYTYYYRPPAPEGRKKRGDFSLAGSDHVYLCAQSLFKVHPDFDAILKGVLARDEKALIVFFHGKHQNWTDLLTERLKGSLGDRIGRVRFLPRQSYEDYLDLAALADVVLDTPHFNGGATTFDALSTGTPVVTLPGLYMRGRQTYALYRRMGVMECVAATPGEYVDKAVRLGTDSEYRREAQEKIRAANHLIFEDMGMVRELEKCLTAMVQENSGGPVVF